MDALLTAILLAALVKGILDFLTQPIIRKYPQADLWWMDYVAFVFGAGVAWLAGVNLLVGYIGDPLIARILSALIIGAGAPLVNSLFGPVQGRPAVPMYRTGPRAVDAKVEPRRGVRGW